MATTTSAPGASIAGGSFLLETRSPEEIFTPEDFSEQHVLIGQTAEEFAQKEIVPNIDKMEHKDGPEWSGNSRSLRRHGAG
jgi:hypothetical protein